MNPETWLASALEPAQQLLRGAVHLAGEWLLSSGMQLNARFALLPEIAAHLPEVSALLLAVAVLMLCRRVRRDRAAMRGMLGQLRSQQRLVDDLTRQQQELERRLSRQRAEVLQLGGRQRRIETRLGRPDPRLAIAMAGSGAETQQLVDSGLSHSEIQLLSALSGRQGEQARPTG